jgi:hypothetical protein
MLAATKTRRSRTKAPARKPTPVRKPKRSPSAALADISLKDDCLLSTAQASKLVGLSQKTLRALRCERAGPPCLKMGGTAQSRVLYRRSALEQWVQRNATPMGGA